MVALLGEKMFVLSGAKVLFPLICFKLLQLEKGKRYD